MKEAVRADLEPKGARVVCATHALSGVERSLFSRSITTLLPRVLLIADTLRLFGQGVKVAVEVSIMASDAGNAVGTGYHRHRRQWPGCGCRPGAQAGKPVGCCLICGSRKLSANRGYSDRRASFKTSHFGRSLRWAIPMLCIGETLSKLAQRVSLLDVRKR